MEREHTKQEPSPEEMKAAISLRRLFESYVDAGFTENQALDIIKAIVSGMSTNYGPPSL